MKKNTYLAYFLAGVLPLFTALGLSAEPQTEGGPNGGRMITQVEPSIEFLVTPERMVELTFINGAGEAVPVGEQTVSLIGGDRSSPTYLKFVAQDGKLISTGALPEMKNMPVVLQIKTGPDAKIVRDKFNLNMSRCGSCGFQEYACICGH